MATLVQHILRHSSGRVSFRRQYPPELRPFIPGPNGMGPTVLKVSLGQEGSPGFLSRYEAVMNQWELDVHGRSRRNCMPADLLKVTSERIPECILSDLQGRYGDDEAVVDRQASDPSPAQ